MDNSAASISSTPVQWLDLAEAARFLGIHFTTLRRWADDGKVPCVRTPGGRRRFTRSDLQKFVDRSREPSRVSRGIETGDTAAGEAAAGERVRAQLSRHPAQQQQWLGHLTEIQRMKLRCSGQMLLGLLMQYNSRGEAGQIFLEEAERIAREYGVICSQSGMAITDTVKAFLFFRQSVFDMIIGASPVGGPEDEAGRKLVEQTNRFMDALLLATIDSYTQCNSLNR